MRTETTEIFAGITPSEEVVLTAVTNLNSGRINEAIANFAEEFRLKITELTWTSMTKSGWRNSSRRRESFIPTLSYKPTRL